MARSETRSDIRGFTVNYAAAWALEIRQPTDGSEPVIRVQFKNGTDDNVFRTLNMSIPGSPDTGDVPVSTFINVFEPAAVNTTLQWCHVCNQTSDRGCAALLSAAGNTTSTTSSHHDRISPVGAGFLGAGLTLAVMLMALAAAGFLGFLAFGRRGRRTSSQRGLSSEDNSLHNEKPVA